jgi:peptidoglycan/LPS O-acetylase OafA/YrhL
MPEAIQEGAKPAKNFDIEALRGFAAVAVAWCHSRDPTIRIAPNFLPTGVFDWGPSGHYAVLLFFVLSGYVIGLNHSEALTLGTTPLYLKKRAVRLLPIFWIILAFTLLVSPVAFDAETILGNALLLQGVLFLQVVLVAWSLHFEAILYLIFIPLSMMRANAWVVAGGAAVLAIANFFWYPWLPTPVLTAYGFGLTYWAAGWALSQWLDKASSARESYQVLLGCLLLLLVVDQFNLFELVSQKILLVRGYDFIFPGMHSPIVVALNVFDLSYLPWAVAMIVIFIGKRAPYKLQVLQALAVITALTLVYHAARSPLSKLTFVQPAFYTAASLVCLFWPAAWLERVGERVIAAGRWLGKISYSIYLSHFALMVLFNRITVFSGTWESFLVRFVLFIALSIGMGYVLDILIQPRIRKFFFPPAQKHLLQPS